MRGGGFTANVKLDYARINELVSASIQALEDTAQEVEKKIIDDEVTPYRTGRLQGSLGVSSGNKGSFYIVYSASYADELYRDYSRIFNRSINSNAQPAWMDYLLSSEAESVRNMYIAAFKKRGKV